MLGGPNMCWNYACSAAKHVLELRTAEGEDDKSPAIHKPESRPCVVRESREELGGKSGGAEGKDSAARSAFLTPCHSG